MTITLSRSYKSNRAYTIGKNWKNLRYIIYFDYNKKGYYISTYIKLIKVFDTLDN